MQRHLPRRGELRRRLTTVLTWTATLILAVASHGWAQGARVPRVGILNSGAATDARVGFFRDELRKLGYVEGRDLTIVFRGAEGEQERLPVLAAELVGSQVDVIVAFGASVWAAKQQTQTVPIVIAFSGDPVRTGMVANLARPGGNLTGVSFMSSDLAAKRLELVKQALPQLARVAVLYNPTERAAIPELEETTTAARALGVQLQPLAGERPEDLALLFAAAEQERADAMLVFAHAFAFQNRDRILALAARHRLPTMYGWREFVDAGGLMSYGPSVQAGVRRSATYVDRILKGAKPGELPIEQPTTFELVVNVNTAKTLGLNIPQSVLLRADQVIR